MMSVSKYKYLDRFPKEYFVFLMPVLIRTDTKYIIMSLYHQADFLKFKLKQKKKTIARPWNPDN